jgi:hypothetical protein
MFLTAPETKGKTLEEMDEVFDSGIPAWKTQSGSSRLDQLQRDIEKGELKITIAAFPTTTTTGTAAPATA